MKENVLKKSSSLYLIQHANQPIYWQEWNELTLNFAKANNSPIIISIGYSSCHWCHVMAHETFELQEVADVMNEFFVCIKVDREELPEIDKYYMDACQIISGSGGWPLNMFCLPDGRPLFGGTYFSKVAWVNLLHQIKSLFYDNSLYVEELAKRVEQGISQLNLEKIVIQHNKQNTENVSAKTLNDMLLRIDKNYGGYNYTPKFIMPHDIIFYINSSLIYENLNCYQHIIVTLEAIASGGIHDYLGGGFFRYSTDYRWKVPHFEKMLYDNAQLLEVYAKAFILEEKPIFKRVTEKLEYFLNHEMKGVNGMYYASIDADSECKEGYYYSWNEAEFNALLGEDAEIFVKYCRVESEGKWENGKGIIFPGKIEEMVFNDHLTEMLQKLEICREKLLQERNKRVRPVTDKKYICSWNALLVSGFVAAACVFERDKYLNYAENLFESIIENLYVNNTLYRIIYSQKNKTQAYADDYANLLKAAIDLYKTTFKDNYLLISIQLMKEAITLFYNSTSGFFSISHNSLLKDAGNKIEYNDDVVPSPNSTFAWCLYQLGFITENENWIVMSKRMLDEIKKITHLISSQMGRWLTIMQLIETGGFEITGHLSDSDNQKIQRRLSGDIYVIRNSNEKKIQICFNNSCSLIENWERDFNVLFQKYK